MYKVPVLIGLICDITILPPPWGYSPFPPQHVIFVLGAVIAWAIPDVPENVENEIKKEKLLAYRAQQAQVAKDNEKMKHDSQSVHEEHGL